MTSQILDPIDSFIAEQPYPKEWEGYYNGACMYHWFLPFHLSDLTGITTTSATLSGVNTFKNLISRPEFEVRLKSVSGSLDDCRVIEKVRIAWLKRFFKNSTEEFRDLAKKILNLSTFKSAPKIEHIYMTFCAYPTFNTLEHIRTIYQIYQDDVDYLIYHQYIQELKDIGILTTHG
jgi:hypothetical protein